MRRADHGGADVLHRKTPLFQHRKAFMNPQEKELLTTLLDRVKNAPRQDKDPEADALIRQALAAQPDLPYYLTQTVLIQDLSLHQAQQRIADLEKQLADAQQAAKPTVGSFLGGLFGRRAARLRPALLRPVHGRVRRRSRQRHRLSPMDSPVMRRSPATANSRWVA